MRCSNAFDTRNGKVDGKLYLSGYFPHTPKKQRTQRELDGLEQYLLETIETAVESITPIVIGDRVVYTPIRRLIPVCDLPQDIRNIITQLKEEQIGEYNLREYIWHLLNGRAFQMRLPIIDSRGGVAILVSNALNEGQSQEVTHWVTYWHGLTGRFYYNLFKRLRHFDGVELGRKPVLRVGATTEDLKEVLHDPYFSSIITIGHGRYGVWSATDKAIDWGDVALYSAGARHLKSGFWIQFSCMPLIEEPLPGQIPFSYFAMRDPNNILGLHDGRDSNGLSYADEYTGVNIGVNGHHTIELVKLRGIAHDSFLPELEAWKKVLKFNDLVETLFIQGNELSSKPDNFSKELGERFIRKSVQLQFGQQK